MANISLRITEGARARQTSAGPSRARRRGGASDRPTVLVLWTGYPPGPRTCRSLKRAGFPVIGAFPEGRHGGSSSGCVRPLRYPSPTADPDGFIARIAEICRTHRVDAIVPLDKDIVRLVAERAPEVGARKSTLADPAGPGRDPVAKPVSGQEAGLSYLQPDASEVERLLSGRTAVAPAEYAIPTQKQTAPGPHPRLRTPGRLTARSTALKSRSLTPADVAELADALD